MKLNFEAECLKKAQADPFIFEDNGKFYLYVTSYHGVEAYSADEICGVWHNEGIICSRDGYKNYWAPCIIKTGGKYYVYFSCEPAGDSGLLPMQCLCVAEGASPLGPFTNVTQLFDEFSIDAHVVETEAGLFLFYAKDSTADTRIGTRVFVDRLLDPYTPERNPVQVIAPTMDEEIFRRNRLGDGRDWHTIEGAFWFREGDYQYVMYSGACYENDTYHIGYAYAKSDEADLTKVQFTKHDKNGGFDPVMIKNGFEEGVGHHSVIKYGGEYYAIYHGRDLTPAEAGSGDRRTARICRLNVNDGTITAERYQDRL